MTAADPSGAFAGRAPDSAFEQQVTLRAVTVLMGAVVGLTFLFGFGNVLILALRLGVPSWVAPLVAPAVDLSVLGLLLGTRYLALHGASREQLRPARRLLVFSSVMTLALNVAAPVISHQMGKAAFDAVGPLLLIGWAEVGPGLLQAIGGVPAAEGIAPMAHAVGRYPIDMALRPAAACDLDARDSERPDRESVAEDDLFERARREDAWHRETYRRPISAETLRKRLHVGAARSRMLVAMVRADAGDASLRS